MKILVTGAAGQLGSDVVRELVHRGHDVLASDYYGADEISSVTHAIDGASYVRMDITSIMETGAVMMQVKPDAVIHCAAWTAVDAAEEPQNEAIVRSLNVDGTANIAMSCAMVGARLMYISTDYVFDGQGEEPWDPDCRDFSPLNVYGRTKLEGENIVRSMLAESFVVRIAWVFGKNGKNFVKTMLALADRYKTLRVVCDQIGTPTYTRDLAVLLADMIVTEKYGTYHATNEGGYISWYDFACEIFRQAGKEVEVLPVTTLEYGRSRAARPFNSRLDKQKLVREGFTPLPDWKDALARFLQEEASTGD